MRLAIIYWPTSSVGGIATHLNSLRTCAIRNGDSCDILRSGNHKNLRAEKFDERKWIRGGDTKIWIDGELPHSAGRIEESIRWLENNYDAIHFGFLCPHPTKAYPSPAFLPLFEDTNLPKSATITDGYWDDYAEWGEKCLPHLNVVTTSGLNYANSLIERGIDVLPLGMPFVPALGRYARKESKPLLIWPNQWKNIKGINSFLGCIPNLPEAVDVELYSCGIRYYQLRTQALWLDAVFEDRFKGFPGRGRAVYFGNVSLEEIYTAFQRAWFTVCLQGMTSRKAAYRQGSYNNTELEALFYGAMPILHESTLNTDIPKEVYAAVSSGDEIPDLVEKLIRDGTALNSERREKARDFVMQNYSAMKQYLIIRERLLASY
ncbi:MAG: hypothetical protein QQN63_10510 [Nitrosopumilus sp.]